MKRITRSVQDEDGNLREYVSEVEDSWVSKPQGIAALLTVLIFTQMVFGLTIIHKLEVLRYEVHERLIQR